MELYLIPNKVGLITVGTSIITGLKIYYYPEGGNIIKTQALGLLIFSIADQVINHRRVRQG